MRERIVEAAHGLFRHYGHAKATVADIAEACGVSTANVYRFFGSKSEINDTICALVLSRLVEDLDAIATAAAPAASRLAQMAERVALFNRQSARSDGRIHEMLIAAVVEDWDAIRQFFREVQLHFAAVVADGIATGEFAAGRSEEHTSELQSH